jgi:hypothetical protein
MLVCHEVGGVLRENGRVLSRSESVYCNTTPGILELDRGADLGLLPHDTPSPDEGAEPLSQTDTLARSNPLGEDAAGRTTDICPER